MHHIRTQLLNFLHFFPTLHILATRGQKVFFLTMFGPHCHKISTKWTWIFTKLSSLVSDGPLRLSWSTEALFGYAHAHICACTLSSQGRKDFFKTMFGPYCHQIPTKWTWIFTKHSSLVSDGPLKSSWSTEECFVDAYAHMCACMLSSHVPLAVVRTFGSIAAKNSYILYMV